MLLGWPGRGTSHVPARRRDVRTGGAYAGYRTILESSRRRPGSAFSSISISTKATRNELSFRWEGEMPISYSGPARRSFSQIRRLLTPCPVGSPPRRSCTPPTTARPVDRARGATESGHLRCWTSTETRFSSVWIAWRPRRSALCHCPGPSRFSSSSPPSVAVFPTHSPGRVEGGRLIDRVTMPDWGVEPGAGVGLCRQRGRPRDVPRPLL